MKMLFCHLNSVYRLRDFFEKKKKGNIRGICHLDLFALIRLDARKLDRGRA